MGQNKIAGYIENTPFRGNSDNDSLVFRRDTSGPDVVPYETHYRSGNSGAPAFLDQGGGNLLLIGTAVFTFSGGSGINYTGNSGNHAAAITDFINASAVPEPSAILLAAIAGIPLFRRRRGPRTLARNA